MKFYHSLQEYDPILTWCFEHFGDAGVNWNVGTDFDMVRRRLRYFITIKDPHDALIFSLAWPCEVAEEDQTC